jgi:hypothetical protein
VDAAVPSPQVFEYESPPARLRRLAEELGDAPNAIIQHWSRKREWLARLDYVRGLLNE